MSLPLINDAFEDLKPYVPGKPVSETERELGISGVVKLASNENPLGPSPLAMKAVAEAVHTIHDYPDGGCYYLKAGLAEHLKLSAEHLIVGNGTNELIEMLIRTVVRPGENVVYQQGSFIVYKLCTQSAGRALKEVPLCDRGYDLDGILDAIDAQTKLVFIANPNNPTGHYIGRADWERFLEKVPEHVVVVADEAYLEYVQADDYPNALDYLHQRERYLVSRTFSKCYGLAGIRVGYMVGAPSLVDYINRGRQPFNVNSLGQVGALAALGDRAHIERSVRLNTEQMGVLVPSLKELGLKVYDSQTNFVLCDFAPHQKTAQEMFQALLRQGVIVRPMAGYGLPSCARITIGTEVQNQKLLAALKHCLV